VWADRRPSGLVFDASVLIDYVESDPALLSLIALHVAPVIIPTPVLAEVSTLTEDDCGDLGIALVDGSLGQLIEASAPSARLSFEDQLCLVVARDGGHVCVTNDGALRNRCRETGVPSWWGLRPLLALVEAGVVDASVAIRAVRAMRASNLYLTPAVVRSFVTELRSAARRRRDKRSADAQP